MFIVERSWHNPLLSPLVEHKWEELGTCNGCPYRDEEVIHLVYRAIAEGDRISMPGASQSVVGYAKSIDGVHFQGRKPIITPELEWEKFGCEDPRITKVDDTFFIFYTALSEFPFNKNGIKVAVALSKDCETMQEKHLVTPFNAKAMSLFPERINGKLYSLLTVNSDAPPAYIGVRAFDRIEDIWDHDKWQSWYEAVEDNSLHLKRHDSEHVEVGAPPVKTKYGWLVIYSHIKEYFSEHKIFGIEAVLLDLNDPLKVIGRTHHPLIVPEEIYERFGYVPNVTFPTGALIEGDYLHIYYGAADTTTCKAKVHVEDLIAAMQPETRLADVKRSTKNPLLKPLSQHHWENKNVFNPAAVKLENKIFILYRAQSTNNTSTIGLAISNDGTTIHERLEEPIYVPREDFEMKKSGEDGFSGCEDPRITHLGNTLYMCYTAYDGIHVPRVAVTSIAVDDFINQNWNAWKQPFLLTPRDVDDKDGCVFPEKIKDKYMILHRVASHICGDMLVSLEASGDKVNKCIEILEPRRGMWDSLKVGIGGPPIKTSEGWILLYHAVDDNKVYRVGAALLDLHDPTHVLNRTADPIFEPQEPYELKGDVSNVVFPCGNVVKDDTIYLYYGGADHVVGVATLSMQRIMEILTR